MLVYVCERERVCVCMYERDRERDRECLAALLLPSPAPPTVVSALSPRLTRSLQLEKVSTYERPAPAPITLIKFSGIARPTLPGSQPAGRERDRER